MNLTRLEQEELEGVVRRGLQEASRGLSEMTGQNIKLADPRVTFLPLQAVPGIAGGPEAVVVAIYLGVEGDVSGHLMVLLTTDSACQLADLLCLKAPGTTQQLDEMDLSALSEAGNVTGSLFLNALSDRTGLTVVPTTPSLIRDMAGAILQAVVATLYVAGDEVLVVETRIGGLVKGHFLLLPDNDSMAKLVAALAPGQ